MRSSELAAAASITLTPHVYPHTSAQLAASLDQAAVWVEYVPWWDELMTYDLEVTEGLVTVPNIVGNGIDLDPEQVERRATSSWLNLLA